MDIGNITIVNANPSKILPPAKRKSFHDTLQYVAEEVKKRYKTPDDAYFRLDMYGELSTTVKKLSVTCNLTPIRNKKNGPKLTIDATYASDTSMTEYLLEDILKVLENYGLSALYNRSNAETVVKIDEKSHPTNDDAADALVYSGLWNELVNNDVKVLGSNLVTNAIIEGQDEEIKRLEERIAELEKKLSEK